MQGNLLVPVFGNQSPKFKSCHRCQPMTIANDNIASLGWLFANEMKKAKRNGSWFRLATIERSLYSLALRLQVRFKSPRLMKAMVSILKKMKQLGDDLYKALVRASNLAWAFSDAAVSWGNKEAKDWRNDRVYINYLGLMHLPKIRP